MTACVLALNSSSLAFPMNVGVSAGAKALERQARELQDISRESITIGWHHEEMLRGLCLAAIECTVDNWDSFGAKALDVRSLSTAVRFAHLLAVNVPVPDIYVDPDGEITFEWYVNRRSVFSVTARRNRELAYAGLFGVNKICGVQHIDDELPDTILDSIFRVFTEETAYAIDKHGQSW